MQRKVEKYQKEKYPFLINSLVHTLSGQNVVNPTRKRKNERELDRRLRKENSVSSKDSVIKRFKECLEATGHSDFLARLEKHHLKIYCRGRTVGIIDKMANNRKYRLKKLSLANKYEKRKGWWQKIASRQHDIERS